MYEYNTSSGIVLSPNYAGRYPSNIQCVYSFSFGPNQVLALRFLSFELEKEVKDGSCSDFVRVSVCVVGGGVDKIKKFGKNK